MKKFNLALICVVASIGGLLFGFDTAVISGTIDFIRNYFHLTEGMVGWFTSSALVGCILGAAVTGKLSDSYGRKPVLIVAAAMFIICAIGCMYPQTFSALIFFRIIGGFGIGMASVVAPLFISEFAPAKHRGVLVALYQLSIVIGILLAYFSNWLLLKSSHDSVFESQFLQTIINKEVWRSMFGVGVIPAALFALLLMIVPESPRWLVQAGKDAKGLKVLKMMNSEEESVKIFNDIKETRHTEEASIKDFFKPGIRLALLLGIAISVFGQFSGVNIVIYYGVDILNNAFHSTDMAFTCQIIIGFINLLFTIVAMLVIDKIGRRPLLVGGMGAVSVILILTGILYMIPNINPMLILVMICIYIACIAISICAVIFVITPEIFPNRLRGRAMSICIFANWGTNTLAAFVFPVYVAAFGMGASFITFGVICILGTFIFYKYIPETKGKSLEEIEKLWK